MHREEKTKTILSTLELTPREREVLEQILRGQSNREIANELGCGVRTVQSHVSKILKKARMPSRLQLILALLDAPRKDCSSNLRTLSPFVQGSLRRHLSHTQRINSIAGLTATVLRPRRVPATVSQSIPRQMRTRTLRRGEAQRGDTSWIVSWDAF